MPSEIVIPRLGWSMEEGTFVQWLRQDGDSIKQGEILFELEGEKAVQEIEAVDAGVLSIPTDGPKPGEVLKVGSVVGYLLGVGEQAPRSVKPAATGVAVQKSAAVSEESVVSIAAVPPGASPAVRRMARQMGVSLDDLAGSGPGGRVLPADLQASTRVGNAFARAETTIPIRPRSSPRARRIARELGIDWTRLNGSGTRGRICERDVRAAAQTNRPVSKNSDLEPGTSRIGVSSKRRIIAERMSISTQQAAPVTLHCRVDATNLVSLRQQFKNSDRQEVVPTYQDIILKLVASSLQEHLMLAARWEETSITLPAKDQIHLGMAVDTPEGLLVPVIKNVSTRSLLDVAVESRRLIGLTPSGKLPGNEMQGGGFTVTNLGAFGVEYFSPIINLPQTAILGLGAIRREATVMPDGTIAAREQLFLSLTFDHRVVDGAPAARFLQALVGRISNPSAWLI